MALGDPFALSEDRGGMCREIRRNPCSRSDSMSGSAADHEFHTKLLFLLGDMKGTNGLSYVTLF